MPAVDELVVAGYVACGRCGEWIPEGRRLCGDCTKAVETEAATVELAYEVAGRRLVSRPTRGRRRKSGRDPERHRLWNRARSRATARLVKIHHPLYEVLLAQEKAALGLDPRLDDRSPGSGAIERSLG